MAYKHMMAWVSSVMLGAREGAPAGVNPNYRRTTGLRVWRLGHTQSLSHNNPIHSRISGIHKALPLLSMIGSSHNCAMKFPKVPKVKVFGFIIYYWCIVIVCMVHLKS